MAGPAVFSSAVRWARVGVAVTLVAVAGCDDEQTEGRIAALETKVGELETALQEQEKTQTEARSFALERIGALESQVAALEADKVSMAQQLQLASETLATLQTTVDGLGNELAEAGTVSKSHLLVGVFECDEYIVKYRQCIEDELPEAVQETATRALETSIDAWRKAAATPAGREGLAMACKTAMEAVSASCGF